LGKKAQDLVIKKGFPINIFKVTTETKTSSGVKVTTETSSTQKKKMRFCQLLNPNMLIPTNLK